MRRSGTPFATTGPSWPPMMTPGMVNTTRLATVSRASPPSCTKSTRWVTLAARAVTATTTTPVATEMRVGTRQRFTSANELASPSPVEIKPRTIPVGGYQGWDTLLNYGSLLYKPTDAPLEEISFFFGGGILPVRSPVSPTGKEGAWLTAT